MRATRRADTLLLVPTSLFCISTVRRTRPRRNAADYLTLTVLCPHTDVFPLKLSSVLGRSWDPDSDLSYLLKKFESPSTGFLDPIGLVKRAIPKSIPMKVTEIIPRLKDGGAFVKFSHPAEISATEIEG